MTMTPDPNDDDVLAFMEEQMTDVVEAEDELALPTKTVPELLSMRSKVQLELQERGEMLYPKTDRGHELHSLNGAIQFALAEKGEGRA